MIDVAHLFIKIGSPRILSLKQAFGPVTLKCSRIANTVITGVLIAKHNDYIACCPFTQNYASRRSNQMCKAEKKSVARHRYSRSLDFEQITRVVRTIILFLQN